LGQERAPAAEACEEHQYTEPTQEESHIHVEDCSRTECRRGPIVRKRCCRILRERYVPPRRSRSNRFDALTRAAFRAAIVAGWSYFLMRAIATFGPASDINNIDFNSDSAIPVLMANDQRPITIFNFYYYCADRWGGWPFLPMQIAERMAGYHWTANSIFVVQAIWLFVGAMALAGLSRRDGLIAGLVYLIALCLHRDAHYLIFELSQVYAWQTTAMLLGWWALRRFFDRRLPSAEGQDAWSQWVWLLAAFGFSYLAIWSSVASVLFLSLLLALEGVRAWSRQFSPPRFRVVLSACALGFLAIAAATAIEHLQKMAYRRFSLAHYGSPFSTEFVLDTGHLADNLAVQLRLIGHLSWWPLDALAVLLVLALAITATSCAIRRNEAVRAQLRSALADDTVILAVAAAGIAILNFTLAVVVSHVRANSYDIRYLTLTNLFGPVSGLLTVWLLLRVAVGESYVRHVRTAGVLAVAAWLAGTFPKARPSIEYQRSEATALALAGRAPHAVLMGNYWDTYVFTALQGDSAMVPVPFEDSVTRTPWTIESVRRASLVIVACPRSAPGAPVSPPQTLQQYGRTFTLVDPRWHETTAYAFAQYVLQKR